MIGHSFTFEHPVHAPPIHRKLGGNRVERAFADRHQAADNALHLFGKIQISLPGDGTQAFREQGISSRIGAGNRPLEISDGKEQRRLLGVEMRHAAKGFLERRRIMRPAVWQQDRHRLPFGAAQSTHQAYADCHGCVINLIDDRTLRIEQNVAERCDLAIDESGRHRAAIVQMQILLKIGDGRPDIGAFLHDLAQHPQRIAGGARAE
ncbi:MAG TPA: hypothetical protein VLS26_02425, partial [Azonexus sp.]|nr:hypothetical protein [Azonexus sp.]